MPWYLLKLWWKGSRKSRLENIMSTIVVKLSYALEGSQRMTIFIMCWLPFFPKKYAPDPIFSKGYNLTDKVSTHLLNLQWEASGIDGMKYQLYESLHKLFPVSLFWDCFHLWTSKSFSWRQYNYPIVFMGLRMQREVGISVENIYFP